MAGVIVAPEKQRGPSLLGSLLTLGAPFVPGAGGILMGGAGALLNGQQPAAPGVATGAKAPVQASAGQGTTGFTPQQPAANNSFRDAYLYNNRVRR